MGAFSFGPFMCWTFAPLPAWRQYENLSARTRVTPNALTVSGVLLCAAASVLVLFENRNELVFFWLGAVVFVAGSILDILDGALARAGGKTTPFGSFLDSTTDRVSEGFMLAAIAYVFAREGQDVFVVVAVAWLVGAGELSHSVAGSVDVLHLVALGELPVRTYLLSFLLPAVVGNSIGGVALVAALNHAQVVAGARAR